MPAIGTCELCGRAEVALTKHHLIPKTRHANKKNKKLFDRAEVRTRLALVCRPCHAHAHTVLSEKEMEQGFNTLEALAAHPEIQKFTAWIRTKPPGFKPTGGGRASRQDRQRPPRGGYVDPYGSVQAEG